MHVDISCRKPVRSLTALLAAALMAGCGGGGDSGTSVAGATACDLDAQKEWLRGTMLDTYYWTGLSPNPPPAGFNSVGGYLDALRYGGDSVVPRDRWSYIQDTASYQQFFGDGQTLGYGTFVNGIEGVLPLRLRYVEPLSPAATAGLRRGDVIVSINGRSAADVVAANDFSALSPGHAGDTVNLVVDSGAGPANVALTAAVYTLLPVSATSVLTLPNGKRVGYVVLKDFITQAEPPLADAIAGFRSAGATELILDLRYNGGGRVSTATLLASLIAGSAQNGHVFANLVFNARLSGSNTAYRINSSTPSPWQRVVVLTGPRTCSASELVVNGLKPFMEVVTIGAASCGKPFGFTPSTSCNSTYSLVNFESFNASGAGRYYAGIAATCPVTDDFSGALGSPSEKLTAAATSYLQSGTCPPVLDGGMARPAFTRDARAPRGTNEPGERAGMWAD